jgi:hypothetical protein
MSDLLTIQNLRLGLAAWDTRPTWPKDLHATFYQELATAQSDGLTEAWWSQIVDHLAAWVALRPRSKADITDCGLPVLGDLQREADAIRAASNQANPVIGDCSWTTASGLFDVAKKIKNVESPVFASKLCHFILPGVFPVIDGELIGNTSREYRSYWQECRHEWNACPIEADLHAEIRARVPENNSAGFPWRTKLFELCKAGEKAAT